MNKADDLKRIADSTRSNGLVYDGNRYVSIYWGDEIEAMTGKRPSEFDEEIKRMIVCLPGVRFD